MKIKFKSRYIRVLKAGVRESLCCLAPDYKPGLRSYSQSGEDLVMHDFYEDLLRAGYKGSYVDVGCHHPFRFSNTCIFYWEGWTGLNIDPDPRAIAVFNKFRTKDINLELAVSNTSEPMVFNMFNEGAINSFDAKLSDSRIGKNRWKIIEKRTLVPRTLASILDEYWKTGRGIDFLDVDAEGFDYEVLVSNNWLKYRPKFVLVEDGAGLEFPMGSKIHIFLSDMGYKLAAATRRTCIFKSL